MFPRAMLKDNVDSRGALLRDAYEQLLAYAGLV